MIEWIVTSFVLIMTVIVLRRVTAGHISSRLRYVLWLPVLLRLLIPVSFGDGAFSAANALPERTVSRVENAITEPIAYVGYEYPDLSVVEPDPYLSEEERKLQYEENLAQWEAEREAAIISTGRAVTLKNLLTAVWPAGAAVVGLCLVISNLCFAARLRRSRTAVNIDAALPVYVSGIVETPCLFGLFRPAIYLTPEAAEDETTLRHVLVHECTHARHGDHIWSALRGICIALHWFDPLVWLAARLSRQDAELACDEGAILSLGEADRLSYGRTLIALSIGHAGFLLTATTMSGDKKSLRERVELIAKKPRNAVITTAVVLLIAAIAVVFTFTGGKSRDGWQSIDAAMPVPENCVNIMEGEIAWPETAMVYKAIFEYDKSADEIEHQLEETIAGDGFAVVSGGIRLTNSSGKVRRIDDVFPYNAQPDAVYGYQIREIRKSNYGAGDLDFMPIGEAAAKARSTLEDIGLVNLQLREAYTIDRETLAGDVAKVLASSDMTEEEMREYYSYLFETVTEEDECYFFVFQVALDDVPVLTATSTMVELEIHGAEIYCLFDERGIIDLYANKAPGSVEAVGKPQNIIPADEAMRLISRYINSAERNIEELTLCYTYQTRKSSILRPTWVMKTSYEAERLDYNGEPKMVKLYVYYAVDAITGEALLREMR